MSNTLENQQFNNLLRIFKKYDTNKKHIKFLKEAYDFSLTIHGYKQRSGEESYLLHVLRMSIILAELESDYITIAASLLHETIRADNADIEEIKEKFGEEVTNIILAVDKISRLKLNTSTDAMIQGQRKIFVGLAKDVRVIIIKLADRLDNMRYLDNLDKEEQKRKAKETLEILAPIAHRLGLNKIKGELENLSLKYLKPDVYQNILEQLAETSDERDKAVSQMEKELIDILEKNKFKYKIKGRSKSIYSIYKKLDKGKSLNQIYDLLALRILVEEEQDCYAIIGLIHSKYKFIPKRFKDYIAMPKSNMYQSLHTTLFGNDKNMFEIQVRTFDMDEIAEKGIASHWSYKEKKKNTEALYGMEKKLEIFRKKIESTEEGASVDSIDDISEEILNEEIYVYTPKGDVIALPRGSTPIDFAYKIHTKVGDSVIGAIINDEIEPLSYKLSSGDIVKINTTKKQSAPKQEWLNFVKTTQAKNRIKNYFKKIEKEEAIKNGEEELKTLFRRKKIDLNTLTNLAIIKPVLEENNLKNIEELYFAIGTNRITSGCVVNYLKEEHKTKEEILLNRVLNSDTKEINIKNDIIVEGIDDIKATIAKCCQPVLGDQIEGYITKGKGISIHRSDCPNITDKKRTISVKWNKINNKKYKTSIKIEARKEKDSLIKIINKSGNKDIVIDSVKTTEKNDRVYYDLTILIPDNITVDKYLSDIYTLNFIINAERILR